MVRGIRCLSFVVFLQLSVIPKENKFIHFSLLDCLKLVLLFLLSIFCFGQFCHSYKFNLGVFFMVKMDREPSSFFDISLLSYLVG